MREDLIEAMSKLLFNERMSSMLVAMCRICTKDEERTLIMKIVELQKLKPGQIGLNEYFTLDKSSNIWTIFNEQFKDVNQSLTPKYTADDGDVGGSSGSNEDRAEGEPNQKLDKNLKTFRADYIQSMMPASILEETDDEEDSDDSELARLEEEKARESIMTIRKEYR